MRRSIRTRLLKTFLILLCAALALSFAFSLAGMRYLRDSAETSAERLGEEAAKNSEAMLIDQALDAARSFVEEKAVTIDERLKSFVRAVDEMAAYTAYLYEHPDRFVPRPVPTPDELVAGGLPNGPTLHYLPATKDIAGTPEATRENALLGNLEGVFAAVLANTPEISSVYTAHESGANIGYDQYAADKAGIGAFDCRGLDWYVTAKRTDSLYVSETYPDSFGRGLTVTMARPITVNGAFGGVLGVDLLIESINKEILNTQFGAGGYAMLFSEDGSAISARGLSEENSAPDALLGTQADAALEAMRASETGAVRSEIGGEPVYILFAPVATTRWKLTVVMPVGEILAPAARSSAAIDEIIRGARADMGDIIGNLNFIMVGAFAALAAAFIAIVRGACGRISRPILKLSEDVRQIGEGKLDYRPDIHTGDEIELLSRSFERMTASLRDYIENLTRVTAEKERIGAELGVATRIQASMLPCIFPPFPDRPEFDIYATMTPAKEVGGDFYDFFMVDGDHLAVVIADVSGKGIPAALFMMTAKTLVKTLAQTGLSPAQVFTEANARLSENNDAGMFVTAWMGVLEISTGRFAYVNAGHNPPLIRRAGGDFQFLRSRAAFVLAGMEGIRYRQEEALFSPGDMLYIYTDGVTEATDPEDRLYGDERLMRVLNAQRTPDLAAILRSVKEDVDAFAAGAPQFDDITMLALCFGKRGEKT